MTEPQWTKVVACIAEGSDCVLVVGSRCLGMPWSQAWHNHDNLDTCEMITAGATRNDDDDVDCWKLPWQAAYMWSQAVQAADHLWLLRQ